MQNSIERLFWAGNQGNYQNLVELIDAKGIDVSQPIWPKNTKKVFFACFRPYVGQPHGHIG